MKIFFSEEIEATNGADIDVTITVEDISTSDYSYEIDPTREIKFSWSTSIDSGTKCTLLFNRP